MKEYFKISQEIGSIFTISSWLYFPLQLQVLNESRQKAKNNDEIVAINLLTILSLTAFLESILFETLNDVIQRLKYKNEDELLVNLIANFEQEIANSTFRDYSQLSKVLLGEGINNFTSDLNWEGIKILFQLRNQVSHGKDFSIYSIYDENDNILNFDYPTRYKMIIEYLVKKSLLPKSEGPFSHSDILSLNVINHFIILGQSFFVDITKNISSKFDTNRYKTFEFVKEQMEVIRPVI